MAIETRPNPAQPQPASVNQPAPCDCRYPCDCDVQEGQERIQSDPREAPPSHTGEKSKPAPRP